MVTFHICLKNVLLMMPSFNISYITIVLLLIILLLIMTMPNTHYYQARLSLTFSEDYPHKPPTVTFVDKSVLLKFFVVVFHVYVLAQPKICHCYPNSLHCKPSFWFQAWCNIQMLTPTGEIAEGPKKCLLPSVYKRFQMFITRVYHPNVYKFL